MMEVEQKNAYTYLDPSITPKSYALQFNIMGEGTLASANFPDFSETENLVATVGSFTSLLRPLTIVFTY